jgi:DNA-binding MarR family transcriptional regulator
MPTGNSFDPIAEARRQWVSRWGKAPATAMVAVTSIMRAQQILMARLNLALKPLELTFPRYEALMILYLSRRGSMPLGKIGDRLQIHPTSVTSLIDGLERAGHIVRIPHEHDRRATLAQISDAGRAAAETATELLNAERFFTEPLRGTELKQLAAWIQPLRAAADGFDAEARRTPRR